MSIPDYESCMLPLMRIASDGKEHRFKDAIEAIAQEFSLTEEERQQLLPSGVAHVINNRVGWAKTHLTKAGLLSKTGRGYFQITESGHQLLTSSPTKITSKMLRQYESFNEFQAKKIGQDESSNIAVSENDARQTPQEIIEAGYSAIKSALSSELLSIIKSISPGRFENLVVELLVKMGYGGSFKEAATVVGKSGDAGIDGIIKEDKLGLDVIYIQAKKWEGSVGRPEIQKFAGALLGQKAKKGIFITTSFFTADAKAYVENIEAKIILIDGPRLTDLMIENNLGVSTQSTYEIKRIDSDYFEEE
ncbi:MAG: restriction endonuclease [Moraxellaceae bacterium]|nr:restriction endonuclease [Moraxellaceae bacterium]